MARLPQLVASLLILILAVATGSLCIQDDKFSERALLEEQNQSKVFRHRSFFYFNLTGTHLDPSNFQVRGTRDAFQLVTESPPRLANLTLQAQSRRHALNHDGKPDTQHVIQTGRLPRIEPNITDKETVVNLAKMTSDAYIFDPREPEWLNTSLGYNFTSRFGWLGDGVRGHVFTTEDNSSVVISFKGTSIDPRNRFRGRDRVNDNKLFGCCCGAQNPWHYAPVCNCATGFNQCDSKCLRRALLSNDSYYNAAVFVVNEVMTWYPGAFFWTVGHSLGGSLASLAGMTLDIPAVTFEAPPERLAAERIQAWPLHGKDRAAPHHFGNTADPIHMGECNGFRSACAFWGYVFDSKCFSGTRCLYDTIKDKGWRSSILNHRIDYVIENVLKAYDEVPACVPEEECIDCADWNFAQALA